MQQKGNGSIVYDKVNKSYRAFVVTPAGKRISKRFKVQADAVEWKNEQLADISRNSFIEPNKICLGDWIVKWLDTYKKDSIKQRTYERYISLAKHLTPLAGVKLQDLHPADIQELYKNMPSLSASTINKVHKLLKDAMNKAFELEMTRKNIMGQVVPPKFEKKEIEIFNRDEIALILKTAHETKKYQRYYPMILLAATTGMRLGEVLGLRWCDVLFNSSQVFVRKSLQNSLTEGFLLESPKTKAGVRKIFLTNDVVRELQELKKHTINMDINQETLCFRTTTDNPIAPNNFERMWKKLLTFANVQYRNFHVLRHTHATELLASGNPLVDTAKRLGHSRVSHTYELYGHAIPGSDKKIADFVQQLYVIPK